MTQRWDPGLYDARHGFVTRYGEDLVELLAPRPGERILDLGSGSGHLAGRIAETGATVVGLDRSAEMVAAARQAYPEIAFVQGDAADFAFDEPFDAVFSNATLHWVANAEDAAGCIARSLRPGGRLVAELGGRNNVGGLLTALRAAIAKVGGREPVSSSFFPSLGQYATILERQGLEVTFAHLFDRPTPLEGEEGLRIWVQMFRGGWLEGLAAAEREQVFAALERRLRPTHWREGRWYADYRRLRVVAWKPPSDLPEA